MSLSNVFGLATMLSRFTRWMFCFGLGCSAPSLIFFLSSVFSGVPVYSSSRAVSTDPDFISFWVVSAKPESYSSRVLSTKPVFLFV